MEKKRYMTKKLKEKLTKDYLETQSLLVDIWDIMVHEKLYGNEEYYDDKLAKLTEFLANEIYR